MRVCHSSCFKTLLERRLLRILYLYLLAAEYLKVVASRLL